MNVRLQHVLAIVSGTSGLAIIDALLAGKAMWFMSGLLVRLRIAFGRMVAGAGVHDVRLLEVGAAGVQPAGRLPRPLVPRIRLEHWHIPRSS